MRLSYNCNYMTKSIFSLYLVVLAFTNCSPQKISAAKCKEWSKLNYSDDSPLITPLIIGGDKARDKEFPHMAVIGFGEAPNSVMYWDCGGALISDLYVLTAAHCLKSRARGVAQKVRLGSTTLSETTPGMQEIPIAKRIAHPEFAPPSKYNDIALFKLKRQAQFSAYVKPACLNVAPPVEGTLVQAIGFGKVDAEDMNGSKDLMKVDLNVYAKKQCEQAFTHLVRNLPNGISDRMLCVGNLQGGKDTCQGDSGGPLHTAVTEPRFTYVVIGITSFGISCGYENSPAIYTNVYQYIAWIEGIVWPN